MGLAVVQGTTTRMSNEVEVGNGMVVVGAAGRRGVDAFCRQQEASSQVRLFGQPVPKRSDVQWLLGCGFC